MYTYWTDNVVIYVKRVWDLEVSIPNGVFATPEAALEAARKRMG